LLALGILAGIAAVDVASSRVVPGSSDVLEAWAPWLGVLVFAPGVAVANSAPARSFPGLPIVLYASWSAQVAGNAAFGAYVGTFLWLRSCGHSS
jgi:hypothetical protein